jgi:hypothetical protein
MFIKPERLCHAAVRCLSDCLLPCPLPAFVYRHSSARVIDDPTRLSMTKLSSSGGLNHSLRRSVMLGTKGAMYLLQEFNVDNVIQALAPQRTRCHSRLLRYRATDLLTHGIDQYSLNPQSFAFARRSLFTHFPDPALMATLTGSMNLQTDPQDHCFKFIIQPSSLVAITPLLGRHRLITQLRGCATRHVFLRTIAGGPCINQRIFIHIQKLYRNIFHCES